MKTCKWKLMKIDEDIQMKIDEDIQMEIDENR